LGVALVVMRKTFFSPVLIYNLIRTGRRGRYVLLRCLYALVLLVILGSVYVQNSASNIRPLPNYRLRVGSSFYVAGSTTYMLGSTTFEDYGAARRAELARFAEAFFSTFILVQLLAVVVLTPAYTAGTIAEEKDRKTLEFLLATDLKDH